MKKYLVLALVGFFASGCSSVAMKNLKVVTDPSDAVIRVVSGIELKEQKYSSPATIRIAVPKDPALAAKAILEVQKENYKPKIVAIRTLKDGDTLMIKLERAVPRYRLKYRLISPGVSHELQYRDKTIAVSFDVHEQLFQMRFKNVSSQDVKILWERSEYTDVYNRRYRLMHSGIRYQDRNNPIPDQIVPAGSSIQEAVIPIGNIYISISPQKMSYDIKPLFTLDGEATAGLKGNGFNLFIPVEMDRQIIPYNFKIEIIDAVKETIKD